MTQGYSLKDQLFNAEKTRYLAGLFAQAEPGFNPDTFQAQVMSRLTELELKERMAWIAECLQREVPGELPEVAPVILRALPPPLDPSLTDDDFGDFIFSPLGDWVAQIGAEHPELALDVLEELTQRFSMEWAIRPFLNTHPDLVLEQMNTWCGHSSYHVRRLVSEGTRPRLPWGQAVELDLSDPLPLLDRLHGDGTRYVTRSVANHLNDITKKDPDLVLDRLQRWQGASAQCESEMRWMIGHALRGLIKSGHPGAMAMLGYDPEVPLQVVLQVDEQACIGAALEFTVTIEGPPNQPVLVDYIIHFQRPRGKTSRKVHKLKQTNLGDGRLEVVKRHKFKGNASTFQLVPGLHRLEIQINGKVCTGVDFDLVA